MSSLTKMPVHPPNKFIGIRLDTFRTIFGFSIASLATIIAFTPGWSNNPQVLLWTFSILAGGGVIFGLLLDSSKGYWLSFQVASNILAALLGAYYLAIESSVQPAVQLLTASALLAIPNIIITLCVYRIHPIFYFPTIALIWIGNSTTYNSALWGLTIATLATILFICTNFLIQSFIDHAWELMQWREGGTFAKAKKIVIQSAIPTTLAVALAALGAFLYLQAQKSVTHEIYASGAVRQDPNFDDLNLKRDLIYTLQTNQDRDVSLAFSRIEELSTNAEKAAKEAPGVASELILKHRPPLINDSPCGKIHWSVRWLLSPICRSFFGSFNDLIQNAFLEIHSTTIEYINEKSKNAQSNNEKNTSSIQRSVNDALNKSYSRYYSAIEYAFAYISIANWISLIYLLGAITAVFQWFTCRVAFDRKGPTFRLSGVDGADEAVEFHAQEKISLDKFGDRIWFISKIGVNAKGDGLAENNIPIQPLNCILGRLREGKYVMSKASVRRASPDYSAQISVSSPYSLVVISVKKGQQLVFRISDLAAFSDGVKIKSRYSTHSATNFMQIGRFYTVAEGVGYIILKAFGEVSQPVSGSTFSPMDLLAWDMRASFSLDQSTKGFGMWLNDARLVLRTDNISVVSQSSDYHGSRISCKLWRLMRFVAVSW